MDYLPLFLDLRNRSALVVGGGAVAARKVSLLRAAGARVHVIAPACNEDLRGLQAQGVIDTSERAFWPADVVGKAVVIAATNDARINEQVAQAARHHNIPVNVVDQPALCSFILPAVVDRSPLLIAVSSGGAAPVLARRLRAQLEALIPMAYGRLAAMARRYRATVKRHIATTTGRRRFWETVFAGPIGERVLAGREAEGERLLLQALSGQAPVVGEVYLVGAGPGDPELLTLRALRLMQQADVVLYDRLVSAPVLDLVRREAERVDVGKCCGKHTLPQGKINALLLRYAREGKRVLRLKGGDPFIFGRGGEEIESLAQAGVPFQVVPGITAASGCAAYAGIPLTHRDYAQSVTFVAGHQRSEGLDLNWAELAKPGQTLVFYMGLGNVDALCQGLTAHGLPATWPAAIIENGTRPHQRVHAGTLATLPGLAATASTPSLVIIGEVVRLHATLSWFEGDVHGGPVSQARTAGVETTLWAVTRPRS
jgi:uroporphyrin-III C-methyltransferase/precorrin-2 dehydrogenase/sirohydrochlorin ferrochelatase